MSQIKLISKCFIRPQSEVEQSKRTYHLGPADFKFLGQPYTQTGQLFRKPDDYSPLAFFHKLKHSLCLALVHFYPLAGQFATKRFENEHSCCIYIDCSKGPGAKLIHAAAPDLAVSDVLSINADVPLVIQSFFDLGEKLISYDGHTKPLLSVQITELTDGVFIGFSKSHTVFDGTSFTHFVSIFSEICMGSSSISRIPIFNYTPLIPHGYGPIIKLPNLKPDEFISRLDVNQTRERIFYFSPMSMTMLKAKANEESKSLVGCSSRNNISSYQALAALVWRSITRARNLSFNESTSCALAMNLRPRLNPPLSDNYVGNFLKVFNVIAKVGELLANNLGWSAMLLRQAVLDVDGKAAQAELSEAYTKLFSPVMYTYGPNRVAMSGSPQMDMYGSEFGLGKAVAVRTGFATKWDGKVFTFMGSEGNGSVDVGISLTPETMDALLSDEAFLYFASRSNSELALLSRI